MSTDSNEKSYVHEKLSIINWFYEKSQGKVLFLFNIIGNSFTSFLFIFLSEFSECDVVYINIKVFNRFYSLRYMHVIVNKIFKSFSYQLYSFCRKVLIFVVNIRLGAQQCREETVTSPYLYRLAWNRKDCGIT